MDLGLPSGTLWATCNVGASKPSEGGLYFQWGDTQGYTANQVGIDEGQKMFDWGNYKWGTSSNFTKYTATGATLELEDDAAHVNMGGDWHIPTPNQFKELINGTTSIWTEQNGVDGRLFTSKKDRSKSIFIPAAGYAYDNKVLARGNGADVWSSMLDMDNADYGQHLNCFQGSVYLDYYNRYCGYSVRGVIG